MAKRSLKASPEGILTAKRIFERREWTQEYLASAVGLQTRQSIWKFFTGRPIERYLFIDICFQLDLDWETIVDRPQFDSAEPESFAIQPASASPDSPQASPMLSSIEPADFSDTWQRLRSGMIGTLQIHYQSVVDLLDIYQPVDLSQLYTELTLLPYTQSRRWLETQDLQDRLNYPQQADFRELPFQQSNQNFSRGDSDFELSDFHRKQAQSSIGDSPDQTMDLSQALEAHQRVMLLGKVGAGKSFLLRSLAVQFSAADQPQSMLPLFMPLHQLEVALADLERDSCLATWLLESWPDRPEALTPLLWHWLLTAGKVVLLLDGLDEVSATPRSRLNQVIQRLANIYPEIRIVITSRFGVADALYPGFVPMTVVELNSTQIPQFVDKWFETLASSVSTSQSLAISSEALSALFLEQIFNPRNQRLHDLARTPLLLHLLCLTFCDRQQLPQNRSRLYEYILEIFLEHWDRTRNLRRDPYLLSISASNLIDIFSQVAFSEFECGRILFEKSNILAILANYIAQQPLDPQNASVLSNPEELWQASRLMLDQLIIRYGLLVEDAKGIYTFSQPVFQEYLSARYIVRAAGMLTMAIPNAGLSEETSPLSLDRLAEHILEPRWYEVILLTLEMLPYRTHFLNTLQNQLSRFILRSAKFSQCLHWIDQRAQAVSKRLNPAPGIQALRAFYFGNITNLGLDLAYGLDRSLAWQLPPPLAQDLNLIRLLANINAFAYAPTAEQGIQISLEIQAIAPKADDWSNQVQAILAVLWQKIQQKELVNWPQIDLQIWVTSCQSIIMQMGEIDQFWQWTIEELVQLEQYYWANIFLLECLRKADKSNDHLKPFDLDLVKPPKLEIMHLST